MFESVIVVPTNELTTRSTTFSAPLSNNPFKGNKTGTEETSKSTAGTAVALIRETKVSVKVFTVTTIPLSVKFIFKAYKA